MSADLVQGSPVAEALNAAIQTKVADLGWASGGAECAAMAEYFVLMLANGKTKEDVSSEIAGELLGLGPDDATVPAFAQWLFEQLEVLSSQVPPASASGTGNQNEMAQDDSMMDGTYDPSFDAMADSPTGEFNAPTGPKAMRAGNVRGVGRERRLVGHINRAMDRTHDSALHRVRGQSGISRGPPTGPRMGVGRQPRTTNTRVASVAAGIAGMGGLPGGPPGLNGMNGMNPMNGMPGVGGMNGGMNSGMNPGFVGPDIMAIMEQQNRMLASMQQQLMMQQNGMGNQNGHGNGQGRSLFERSSRPNNFRGRGGHHQNNGHHQHQQQQPPHQQQHQQQQSEDGPVDATAQGEDVEMSQTRREPLSADDTMCKFNLRCQNKDCKFAHQSPAAPPGITIDPKDVCSFGAACKNRKCVGRHPSPAIKAAHQGQMECRFFPNCTNPHCTFSHPSMPPCRNGGECKVPNCKFTHVKTACRFNPCTNRVCPFSHEEGQRGVFKDKVWVADESKEHISERKFVQEGENEDVVIPGSHNSDDTEVIV